MIILIDIEEEEKVQANKVYCISDEEECVKKS